MESASGDSSSPSRFLDVVRGIPYSSGPDSVVEHGVRVHMWSSHLLRGRFLGLFECQGAMPLETHLMDAIVTVDGIFSGHYIAGSRTPLLCGSLSAGPQLTLVAFKISSFSLLLEFFFSNLCFFFKDLLVYLRVCVCERGKGRGAERDRASPSRLPKQIPC